MATTIELFKFNIYHGAEIHVRIIGMEGTSSLTISLDGKEYQKYTVLKEGVLAVPIGGQDYGEHTVEAVLEYQDSTIRSSITFDVPEPDIPESEKHPFKDFWIAVGQPGAYTNANTYVNGLGQTKKYYRVIGAYRDFGIKIKHTPYSLMSKAKNISVQSWKDEDGDDMWLPRITGDIPGEYKPQLTHEVVELNPKFVVFFPVNAQSKKDSDDTSDSRVPKDANEAITNFIKAIEGRWLKIWDEYTGVGYTGVVLVDVDDDPKFKRRNYDYAEFELKFKVNGPNIYEPFEGIK